MDGSVVDLHVAFSLLHMCGSYCKLVHLTRATPPSLCADSLKFFDEDIRLYFSSCLAVDVSDRCVNKYFSVASYGESLALLK